MQAWVNNCFDLAKLFLERTRKSSEGYNEVHVLFDRYLDHSLKKQTRKLRRGGTLKKQYKIEDKTNLKGVPWASFLSHEKTKHALTVYFLADKVKHAFQGEKNSFVTANGITQSDVGFVEVKNHEEADTLIIRHAHLAASNDVIHVVSPDTDVFVLLVAFDSTIPANVFMFGANGKIFYISKLSKAIGERKCKALVGFHAFTGCDTTGKFKGKGKPTWVKRSTLSAHVERTLPKPLLELSIYSHTESPQCYRFWLADGSKG